jgi:predicted AAA+ superfamily ATPase
MPHLRKRYLSEILPNSTKFSSIVGVLGHRQVGKTTLTETTAKRYITLDLKENREFAQKKPGQFILTGSVRFSSKKAIRESLTGRIIYHELIPFTVS